MSDKPSYLGLLNAIAIAEAQAHDYLVAWADVTPSADVRNVLLTVAAREGEHGMSFAKRINELGYEVRRKDNSDLERAMELVTSEPLRSREDGEVEAQPARHRRQARHLRRLLQGPLASTSAPASSSAATSPRSATPPACCAAATTSSSPPTSRERQPPRPTRSRRWRRRSTRCAARSKSSARSCARRPRTRTAAPTAARPRKRRRAPRRAA